MFSLPVPPAWNSMHPILVHLPIGILAIMPVLLVLAMLFGRRNPGLAGATFVALLVGVGALFAAVMSGEAAADIVVPVGDAKGVLHEHEEMAELCRNLFAGLAVVYLVILLIAAGLKDRLKPAGWVAMHLVYLVLFMAALLPLMNAGHLGGRLVHQYGITAKIGGPPPEMGGEDGDKD